MTHYRLFVDTFGSRCAVGGHHPMREPSRALLEASVEDKVELHASDEKVEQIRRRVSSSG